MSAAGAPAAEGLTLLHIGLGSFHRAHQAVYLHRLRESGDRSWSIVGGNIRDDMPETMAALIAQQGEYTLETVSPAGEREYQRIISIREVIPFDPALRRLIEVGAAASTRIISCTVTEAGYYLDPKNRLDASHADLRADLDDGGHRTIYGALAAILRERLQRGGAAVTLLNCDNLRSNGTRLRAGLLDFLQRRGETALRDWVEAYTSCPCNMVDRITPRPSPEVAARVAVATGWADRAPVMGESFSQWVIEDHFIAGRPAWERVGAEMVKSVHAHEEAKIRILNATHSCVAWAGTLLGLSFIHEDMAVPAIRQMAWDYVTKDVIGCLDTAERPCPIDLAAYRDVVLERFGNPHVHDTNQRVAMDGFSKLPGFIVPTIRDCLERGASIDATTMLPALFFNVLGRWHRGELPYTYQDGVMDPAVAHAFFAAPDPLAAFSKDALLWGPLAGDARLVAALRRADARVHAFVEEPTNVEVERLKGRHALLTGAGGGIGLAVTQAFLAEGARCTAVDLAAAPSEDLAALLAAHPQRLAYAPADVSQVGGLGALLDAAAQRFGPVDVLFNNAAVFDMAPLLEADEASYQRLFDVNVKGMFFVMQAVLARLVDAGKTGSIINLASQAGRRGEALVAHYCASKAAVISYTQSAALAMAPHGIRVNAIAPGVIDTAMWQHVDALFARYEGLQPGEKKIAVGKAVPLGYMGAPADVAGAAVFLASAEASYITAQTLNVDGGNVMS